MIDFNSIDSVIDYIESYGVLGIWVTFLMISIHAVIPVIPFFILAAATGMIYGQVQGFLLTWGGVLSGTYLLYFVAKYIGKEFFVRKTGFNISIFDTKYLFLLLLLVRIFPIVPTPVINIGSGIIGVPFNIFAPATAIGTMPVVLVYVCLGDYLMESRNIETALYLLGLVLTVVLAGVFYFRRRLRINK
ncbi:MAG: TVP38/TMEM64 family protein [Syntrophomonadaceae bacterium]